MSETPQPNPYLEQHPNAVQDVEKAHTMAESSKGLRGAAARYRRVSSLALKLSQEDGKYGQNLFNAIEESHASGAPDVERHKELLELTHRGTDNPLQVVKRFESQASYEDSMADSREERAAQQYDVAQDK